MEREWSGNARRLSQVDRAKIESLIWAGATFETAATASAAPLNRSSVFLP
jgi:hypothetical protein